MTSIGRLRSWISKVCDRHPEVLNGLVRHNAALSSELNLMFHFHSSNKAAVEAGRVTEYSAEGLSVPRHESRASFREAEAIVSANARSSDLSALTASS